MTCVAFLMMNLTTATALSSPVPPAAWRDVLTHDSIPGWEVRNGPADAWVVKDGVLTCTGGGTLWGSWIGTREDYTDFILEFDYRLSPGGNSGVLVRVPKVGHPSSVGVEIQILDDYAEKHRNLKPAQYNGSIYKIVPPAKQVTKPAGDWNHMRITAVADHFVVEVNGQTVVDADGTSHPEILRRTPRGPIGFQNHHTEVSFRNIRLADLGREREERLRWFREERFGTLVCWGPVTLKGTEIGWSRGAERPATGGRGEIPVEVYDSLYRQFNPPAFNADEWVALARAGGVRYFVLLTKHHDGFCLFDSKLTDYKITNAPFGRDVCREIADACHRAGMRLGWYYSQPDWHHPDYFTDNHQRYVDYLRGQVRELCTNYGKVDVFWFDGLGLPAGKWDAENLIRMIRELQPGILINDRAGVPGDFDTPEQWIGTTRGARAWETCMTIGDQWSYKPEDRYKSAAECIRALVLTVGRGGNLLLNNGPMPDGRIDPTQAERFRQIGRWLERNGRSIYGTHGGPFMQDAWGLSTCRGSTVYLHVVAWEGDRVRLAPIARRVRNAELLGGGRVEFEQTDDGVRIVVPPERQDPIDTIVALELDGPVDGVWIEPLPSGSLARRVATEEPVITRRGRAGEPSAAVDDDYTTFWHAGRTDGPARLEVDLGRSVVVDRVRLVEVFDRVRAFTIEYRAGTAGDWKPLAAGTHIGPCRTLRFTPVEARSIRLSVNEVDGRGGFQLAELQVFQPR